MFGEEARAVTAFDPEASRRQSPGFRRFVLDAAYLGVLSMALPYLALTGKAGRVRDHMRRRARVLPPRGGKRPCLWVHGVSVGEILSVRFLLKRFQEEFPEWDVVLSTTTRAGLEVGRKHYAGTNVVSYPFDLSYLVGKAFDRLRPDLILIVEHELWPNFLWHAEARQVPVAIVNGRMSERSLRGYERLRRFVAWPPPGIVEYCVEDQVSADAYHRLGVPPERIHVTGNLKFDNCSAPTPGLREELGLGANDWVMVASSTHSGEEAVLLDAFLPLRGADAQARLILVPRRTERTPEISALVRARGLEVVLWSELKLRLASGERSPWRGEVVVVDTMGELDRISTAGDVVFVGGTLVPFGGHNVIAPAGQGRPVIIGPHYHNFRSVVAAFLEREALVVAQDAPDLARKLEELKRNSAGAVALGLRASETVARHSGASERTLDVLRPLLHQLAPRPRVEPAAAH